MTSRLCLGVLALLAALAAPVQAETYPSRPVTIVVPFAAGGGSDLLARLVALPSTDLQARELAAGNRDSFAAWKVEGRSADQLLLSDFRGATRSWLMIARCGHDGMPRTRLYFGSAVVPVVDRKSGKAKPGFAFRALLGFHKLYSRVLLRAAISRLARSEIAGV